MKQVIFSRIYSLGTGSPRYANYSGLGAWSGGEVNPEAGRTSPWSVDGTFLNLYVRMFAPVTNNADISWTATTYTLYINGAATALTVTVPAAGPVSGNGFDAAASNTFDQVSIAAGDTITMVRSPGNTISGIINGASAHMMWSMTFSSTNTGESGYASTSAQVVSNNSNQLPCAILNNNEVAFPVAHSDTITDVGQHSIVPLAGDLFRMDVILSAAPGSGKHQTFVCAVNGVKQDGSGGTPDTTLTVADLNTTGTASFTLPLVPLNLLSVYRLAPTGSPTQARIAISVGFRATTDGESALCFTSGNNEPKNTGPTDYSGNANTGWAWMTGNSPTPTRPPYPRWPTDEDFISLPGAIDPFTLKGFCVNLSASPGNTKSYLFTTRRAGADVDPKLTMTGASGTDSVLFTDPDNGEADYAGTSDTLDISAVATGTPAAAFVGWAWLVLMETEPPPPPPTIVTYQPRWLRRFALPFNQNKWSFISRFELIMQAGVGLSGTSTTQGYDPQVMFRLSRDGGQTWDTELTMSMGKLGAYDYRAFLNRLGRARNPVVELTGSDPVFVTLLDAVVDIDEGMS